MDFIDIDFLEKRHIWFMNLKGMLDMILFRGDEQPPHVPRKYYIHYFEFVMTSILSNSSS